MKKIYSFVLATILALTSLTSHARIIEVSTWTQFSHNMTSIWDFNLSAVDTVRLMADITPVVYTGEEMNNYHIWIDMKRTLDLNGHQLGITYMGTESNAWMDIVKGGNLTIMDSKNGGCIYMDNAGIQGVGLTVFRLMGNARLTVQSGTLWTNYKKAFNEGINSTIECWSSSKTPEDDFTGTIRIEGDAKVREIYGFTKDATILIFGGTIGYAEKMALPQSSYGHRYSGLVGEFGEKCKIWGGTIYGLYYKNSTLPNIFQKASVVLDGASSSYAKMKTLTADELGQKKLELTTKYGINIGGVEVTNENVDNIFNEGEDAAYYTSYDPATNTLYLKGSTINSMINTFNTGEKLNVMCLGFVRIFGSILSYDDVEISGLDNERTIIQTDAKAMAGFTGRELVINPKVEMYVSASSSLDGISCTHLVVNAAKLNAESESGKAINCSNVELNYAKITEGSYAGTSVTIESDVTTYGIKIAGEDVTNVNCSDLSVIKGVSGDISYDPVTGYLHMEGATIDAPQGIAPLVIKEDAPGVVVVSVKGRSNYIKGFPPAFNNVYIEVGNGKRLGFVTEPGNEDSYLFTNVGFRLIDNASVVFENMSLSADVKKGFVFAGKSNNIVSFTNCNASLKSADESVALVDHFRLSDCYINDERPIINRYGDYGALIYGDDNSTTLVTELEITRVHSSNLFIAGQKCTSKGEIRMEEISKGTVSYDPDTRTVTMNNAVINASAGTYGMLFANPENSPITLVLEGKNAIYADGYGIMLGSRNAILNIKGSETASLMVNTSGTTPCMNIAIDAIVNLKDVNLTLEGYWGAYGSDYHRPAWLKVDNSNVDFKTTSHMCYYVQPELTNCHFEPECSYDAAKYCMTKDGEIVHSGKIVADNLNSAVEDVETADTHATRKFIRDGQIYIVRGGRTYNIVGTEVQ